MKSLSVLSLLFLAALAGCGAGTPSALNPPSFTTTNTTGNWQIQSGAGAAPNTLGIALFGDLVQSGTSVTGTFRFFDFAQGNGCGTPNQVITVSGSVDATNPLAQVLNLTSATFNGSVLTTRLTLTSLLQGFSTGTIEIKGTTCVFASAMAIGVLAPPVNGTFTGALAPAAGNTGATGSATLVLAQATSPSADGQFALTGSIQVTGTSCPIATTLTGTASGIGILATSPNSLTSFVQVSATQPAPGMPQNLLTNLVLLTASCSTQTSAQYSGTLNKQ